MSTQSSLTVRTVTWTWAVLSVLTLSTGLLSGGAMRPMLIGILISLAALKIYLIAGVFMGATRAPAIWHGLIVLWLALWVFLIGWLAVRTGA
jgi:cytochrome c oxidase subunit IV